MHRILLDHNKRYPNWAVEDLYKLIHQASLGSEHALADDVQVRERLLRELVEMGPGPKEPLIDAISPDGQVIRVHLRPFVRLRLDHRYLLEAFLRTAREFHGSAVQIERFCSTAVRLVREGELPFHETDFAAFITKMKQASFPAVHHSANFKAVYQPAYRVVGRRFLPPELVQTV